MMFSLDSFDFIRLPSKATTDNSFQNNFHVDLLGLIIMWVDTKLL